MLFRSRQVGDVILVDTVDSLSEKAKLEQWDVFLPPFQYTTDNAAMIGIVGYHKLLNQQLGTMIQSVSARLSL